MQIPQKVRDTLQIVTFQSQSIKKCLTRSVFSVQFYDFLSIVLKFIAHCDEGFVYRKYTELFQKNRMYLFQMEIISGNVL